MFKQNDVARLILRVSLGAMTLFHEADKVVNGIGGVKHLTVKAGLPEFLAYGVYVGELIVPTLIILGLYARMASLVLAFNMVMAIHLAYGSSIFSLGKHGAPAIEVPFLYLILSLAIFFLGSGKYAINSK